MLDSYKDSKVIPNDNFYEEFIKIADRDLMKNLNPTILNAL